jgi:hypothetical protein
MYAFAPFENSALEPISEENPFLRNDSSGCMNLNEAT